MTENFETKEIGESTKDISDLKDEIKSVKSASKQSKNKGKSNKSLLLYKNDIKIKKPKYYGKTKSLLFVGETPIFILTESSKNYYNHLI